MSRSVGVGALHEPCLTWSQLRNEAQELHESWNDSITSNAGVTGPYGANTADPGVLRNQRLGKIRFTLSLAYVLVESEYLT